METTNIETRLKNIFSMLFNVDPASISADSSQDSIQNWDSMQHLNLATSIEKEFAIQLTDQDVVDMLSFELAVKIVFDRLSH